MAKKSNKITKKTAKKRPTLSQSGAAKPRRLKKGNYKAFRLSKPIKHENSKPLSGSFKLLAKSLTIIKQNWRLFIIITLIYGLLSIVLVRGIGGGLDLTDVKSSLKGGFSGQFSQLATGTLLFGYLLGSSGSSATPTGGTYQTILVVLMSLVVIWALRQVIAGNAIRARDAFYNGTYPLIQFILVLMIVSLQLVPLLVGGWVYSAVVNNGIATSGIEKGIWLIMFFFLATLSLYMVTSSVFALYIVTLPNMTPMKALRSARALVKHRRWLVLRKILFLPFILLVLGALLMIPLILLLTPIAEWTFFALSMFVLVVVHSYMYSLYRELL